MNRNDIINRLMENDSTVLSFSDRCEEWGSNKYRGNCTGWIHAFLIWKCKVKKFAEVFAGSGTGYDVCRDMGIPYIGADLNPNPVRSGIMPKDVISEEVPAVFCDADMIFMHPPYGQEIGIPYAGAMYPDPTGELSRCDLGQMPKQFTKDIRDCKMAIWRDVVAAALRRLGGTAHVSDTS